MSDKIAYSEYTELYPETVIIRKEGFFYMVRDESAAIIHAFFAFQGWKSGSGRVSIGFTINSLDAVCEKLEEQTISYIVLANEEIVMGNNFDNRNQFYKYASTDTSDIPYQKKPSKGKAEEREIYMMTDEEKKLCGISITYLERLLQGRHPVNNSVIENDTILTDENVKRCFSFIADILRKHISNEWNNQSDSKEDIKIMFKEDAQDVIEEMIQPKEISASELELIVKSYDKKLFKDEVKKISAVRVSNWLLEKGYLVRVEDVDGKHHREATEDGKIIGITNNVVEGQYGKNYVQYRFTPKAQRFIYENLPEILTIRKKRR